ncbi:MAG: hypothetical protein JST89_07390 [Cyanobacteria bacterium SZAS-4]|nr:hypothetical protein [Cyanobacteria bacterium SZAS-4]
MVVELQKPDVSHNDKVRIPEVGTFAALALDPCQGAVYELTAKDLQLMLEALGFAARFESHLVTTAYLDVTCGDATLLLEISKNSRPADVAVRYSREQWTPNEHRKHLDTRKRILKTSYHADSLTLESIEVICRLLKISPDDFQKYVIRVNFKTGTTTLIISSTDAEKLPAKSICAFSVLNGEVSLAPIEIGESMFPASSAINTVNTVAFSNDAAFSKDPAFGKDVNVQLNSDSWKYATYSQSEVDRLLKIQAENITAAFTAKISAQQKLVQELLSTQEKTSRKISNDVSDQIVEFNISAAKAADNHNEQMKTLMEKAQNEIEVQFEQVKADLDRTLMNDLKSVDKRMQYLEASIQSLSETKQSSNSQALIILVALSVVLSLANLIMLFVHR